MKNTTLILLVLSSVLVVTKVEAQLGPLNNKEIALHRAKFFLADVVGVSNNPQKLIIDPLSASKSTEITSIYFEAGSIRGMLLGFFDIFWDKEGSGRTYQEYDFKLLDEEKAVSLMNKINSIIEEEKKFFNAEDNENNIIFRFDDLDVIIYKEGSTERIRIRWRELEGEWDTNALKRTERRFLKALN